MQLAAVLIRHKAENQSTELHINTGITLLLRAIIYEKGERNGNEKKNQHSSFGGIMLPAV